MAYKVGDKVKIKDVMTNKQAFVEYMEKYLGKTATVTQVEEPVDREERKLSPNIYILDVDGGSWYWWEHMLEPCATTQKIECVVCIKAPTPSWEVGKVYSINEGGYVVKGLTSIAAGNERYFRKLI